MKDPKKRVDFIASCAALAVYLGYMFILAMMQIGVPPKMGTETKWYFPFVMLFAFSVPALFGYLIGRSSGETHGN